MNVNVNLRKAQPFPLNGSARDEYLIPVLMQIWTAFAWIETKCSRYEGFVVSSTSNFSFSWIKLLKNFRINLINWFIQQVKFRQQIIYSNWKRVGSKTLDVIFPNQYERFASEMFHFFFELWTNQIAFLS